MGRLLLAEADEHCRRDYNNEAAEDRERREDEQAEDQLLPENHLAAADPWRKSHQLSFAGRCLRLGAHTEQALRVAGIGIRQRLLSREVEDRGVQHDADVGAHNLRAAREKSGVR